MTTKSSAPGESVGPSYRARLPPSPGAPVRRRLLSFPAADARTHGGTMIRLSPLTLLVLLVGSLAPLPAARRGRRLRRAEAVAQGHADARRPVRPRARHRPNPFLDYRLTVRFAHESGSPSYDVPGYFAADGNAGETSAEEGTKWRAHLSPDKPGRWTWRVSFVKGARAAVDPKATVEPVAGADGATGSFDVLPTDKTGRDFRAHGRLQYVGGHYLRFAGSGDFFLKARRGRAGDAPRLRRLRRHRRDEEGGPAQDVVAPRPRLAAGRPHVEGRQGQGPRRRPQLPREPRA